MLLPKGIRDVLTPHVFMEARFAPTHRRPSEGWDPSRLSVENEKRDRIQPALERRRVCLEKPELLKLEQRFPLPPR